MNKVHLIIALIGLVSISLPSAAAIPTLQADGVLVSDGFANTNVYEEFASTKADRGLFKRKKKKKGDCDCPGSKKSKRKIARERRSRR